MATSPDYLRLATNSARALADTALDGLRDAIVVGDARHKHLPVLLANAAANRCLANVEGVGIIESSLYRWLGAASATTIENSLAGLTDPRSPTNRLLEWQYVDGPTSVMTEIKLLGTAPGQRLLMLTFPPAAPEPRFRVAV